MTNNSKNGNSTDLTQPEDKLKIIDFGLARALGPPGRVSTVVEIQQFQYFDEQHILTAVVFETGTIPTPTKSGNPTTCG